MPTFEVYTRILQERVMVSNGKVVVTFFADTLALDDGNTNVGRDHWAIAKCYTLANERLMDEYATA